MTPSDLSYREISLTRGKTTLVDSCKYDELMQWKWTAISDGSGNFYACRAQFTRSADGKTQRRSIKMHRQVFGLEHGDGIKLDHRSGDTLDNRMQNLRIATSAENAWNRKCFGASGLKGAYKRGGRFISYITANGKRQWLGSFLTAEEAHMAYRLAATRLFGEFACLDRSIFPKKREISPL